nr:hypothetical protein [Tanacetum cinerariifolium]
MNKSVRESAKKKSGGKSFKGVAIQDTPSAPKLKPTTLKPKLKGAQSLTPDKKVAANIMQALKENKKTIKRQPAIQDTPSAPKLKPTTLKPKLKGAQSLTPDKKVAANIMQALEENKKTIKRQPGTGGSSKGTDTILGVLDESTVVSATSSEGTGTKPGVLAEEKDITKENVILGDQNKEVNNRKKTNLMKKRMMIKEGDADDEHSSSALVKLTDLPNSKAKSGSSGTMLSSAESVTFFLITLLLAVFFLIHLASHQNLKSIFLIVFSYSDKLESTYNTIIRDCMIVLIFKVGERLVLFEQVIDDDFGESRVWHIFTSRSSFLTMIYLFSMADSCDPYTCWCTCKVDLCSPDQRGSIDSALLFGQKEFIRICVVNLLDRILELLHKNFRNIYRDSKYLKARGVLDRRSYFI